MAANARRVLVVSDPGIVQAGHTARGIAALEQAGIEVQLFDDVGENPTTDHVAAGLKIAKRFEPELIVGLGGGSSMDCAKGINFRLHQRRTNSRLLGHRQSHASRCCR